MQRIVGMTLVFGMIGGPAARADAPMVEAAARGWAIADAVLARHLEPPARQAMLLEGARKMALATRGVVPDGLARRVSDLTGPAPLAALLEEILAGPEGAGGPAKPRLLPMEDGLTPADVFLAGVASAVPGGATLMDAKERKVQESFEANLYVGIQVQLGMTPKPERPVFIKVLEGGPAEAAGARDGDVIEEVDGVTTEGMTLARVVDRLRGPEGTDVVVRYRRPGTGEVCTKPMTRGTLPRATVEGVAPLPGKRWSVRLDGPAPIGYLKLTEVSGSTARELRAFAEQMESEGLKALVLDLRQARPAPFHPTVLLADALLDGGVIGRVRSAAGETTYRAEPDALFRGRPMVVLARGNPEPELAWLCDALLDNHRASIVGEPSPLGDPTVDEVVPLPGGEWWIRLATGRLERADGRPLSTARRPTGGVAPQGDPAQDIRKAIEQANRAAEEALAQLDREPKGPGDPSKLGVAAAMQRARALVRQANADDLAKAREILAEALKAK